MRSKRKHVLVVGANFVNQGAYLMLVSVTNELESRAGARTVLDLRLGSARQRQEIGASTLVPTRLSRVVSKRLMPAIRLLPGLRQFVHPDEVDAVIDVSGFRYGDQWAHLPLQRYASRLEQFAKRGATVIMLPQAFGPFTDVNVARAAKAAALSASTVMPRDPESTSYLKELLGETSNAPIVAEYADFTGPLSPVEPAGYADYVGRVPIIPNWNIYERAAASDAERYVEGLIAMARELKARGLNPYGLCHEAHGDVAILEKVRDAVPGFQIIEGLNGLELKWLIGKSPFVVAGRFHAVSSALSQGVPVLVHGWSHKYRWMAADYDAADLVVDPFSAASDQIVVMNDTLNDASVADRIRLRGIEVHKRTEGMWETVIRDLNRA